MGKAKRLFSPYPFVPSQLNHALLKFLGLLPLELQLVQQNQFDREQIED